MARVRPVVESMVCVCWRPPHTRTGGLLPVPYHTPPPTATHSKRYKRYSHAHAQYMQKKYPTFCARKPDKLPAV